MRGTTDLLSIATGQSSAEKDSLPCICHVSGMYSTVNITNKDFPVFHQITVSCQTVQIKSPSYQATMSRLNMFLLILLVAIMLTTSVLGRPGARPRCYYGARQSAKPGDCGVEGWVMSACGGRVCRKGPGGVCGGSQGQYGVCGEGLQCSECNRCTGCSYIAFRCYSDHDKCASSDDSFLPS